MLALLALGCAATPEQQVLARARRLLEDARAPGGELRLLCEPADAEVALDGVAQGRCSDFAGLPAGLRVGEGMHRVEVRKEGFYPYQTYYSPGGARATLTITLRRKLNPQGSFR